MIITLFTKTKMEMEMEILLMQNMYITFYTFDSYTLKSVSLVQIRHVERYIIVLAIS